MLQTGLLKWTLTVEQIQSAGGNVSFATVAVTLLQEASLLLFLMLVWGVIMKKWKCAQSPRLASKCSLKASMSPSIATSVVKQRVFDPPQFDRKLASATLPQALATQQQILKLLDQKEFTRAMAMYRVCERDGQDRYFTDEAFFLSWIQSATRVGKADVLERLLLTMKRNSLHPTPDFWHVAFRKLSSRKFFSACILAHELFIAILPEDKIVYSCLINAALECRKPKLAEDMLVSYNKAELEPYDYVQHMRTYCALADVPAAEAAERIFRKLGSAVSNLHLNLLLLAWVSAKRPEKAGELLLEGHTLRGTAAPLVDVVSYNTVMKGFAGVLLPRRCLHFVTDMRRHELEPDSITCSTVLDVCVSESGGELVEEFLAGFESAAMDFTIATLFVKGFARAGCYTKALQLHDKMCGGHNKVDFSACTILVKKLAEAGHIQKGQRLMDQMEATDGPWDDSKVGQMLECCRYFVDLERGQRVFSHAVKLGVRFSEYTLAMMLKLHGRCGANAGAYELLVNWEKSHGVRPSVIHFTCFMSGCAHSKQYDQAWRAYELMQTHGIALDSTALFTLLPAMSAAKRWDRCVISTRQVLQTKPSLCIPIEMLSTVRSEMLTNAAPRELMSEWHLLMQKSYRSSEICIGT